MTAYIDQPTTPTIAPNTSCDRCISTALVRVTMRGRGILYFCGHHYRAHEARLEAAALAIEDERTPTAAFISAQRAPAAA